MLYIPFIFFSFLLYRIIKKNGFDLSACITLMYVIISIFSIILGNDDHEYPYGNYSKVEIGFIPTVVYCTTIGLCIYPFYKYNSNQERELKKIKETKYLDVIVYSYLFVFVFLIAVFWKDILFRIAYGDMGELRQMQYAGLLSNALDTKGGIIRVVGGFFTIIGDGAYFLIPCFFYSLCVLKKSRLYLFSILLGSITPVLLGFINIDRSKTAFWMCLFILSFFMFRKHIITKEQKKVLKQMFSIVGGLLLFYLAIVTISRFGERDEGTSGGLLVYLGQPFINFCNIWDNIDTNHFFVSRVMPLTTFALYGSSGTEKVIDYVMTSASVSGLHLNVFFTFVGMFLVDMGHFAAILIPVFLFLVINRITETYRPKKYVTLSSIIVIFAFAAILQCGIIIYFYTTVPRALAFWFFILYSRRFFK